MHLRSGGDQPPRSAWTGNAGKANRQASCGSSLTRPADLRRSIPGLRQARQERRGVLGSWDRERHEIRPAQHSVGSHTARRAHNVRQRFASACRGACSLRRHGDHPRSDRYAGRSRGRSRPGLVAEAVPGSADARRACRGGRAAGGEGPRRRRSAGDQATARDRQVWRHVAAGFHRAWGRVECVAGRDRAGLVARLGLDRQQGNAQRREKLECERRWPCDHGGTAPRHAVERRASVHRR